MYDEKRIMKIYQAVSDTCKENFPLELYNAWCIDRWEEKEIQYWKKKAEFWEECYQSTSDKFQEYLNSLNREDA